MRKLGVAAAAVLGLMLPCMSKAQTTINSDGVSVRNSAPANVFFMFPVGDSNITEIQLGCSASGVNHNYIFVYEEQPSGPQGNFPQIVTYPFQVEVDCTETYGPGPLGANSSFTATLVNDITVTTPDHTITISHSTAWTAQKVSSRTGPYWKATGGAAQIVVQ